MLSISTLLQMDTLQKILFNTVLVSIPEEFYLVMFVLILVGEFEYWEEAECKLLIHRFDCVRLLVPTVVGALLSNVFRYGGIEFGMASLIPPLVFFILIVLTNDILGDASAFKWTVKAFAFLLLGIITIYISELLYVPFILYGAEKTLADINNDIILNFIVSIPSKLLLYSVLIFLVVRKRTLLRANIFNLLFSNKLVAFLTFLMVTFNFVFLLIMVKIIAYNKALIHIHSDLRIVVILGICLLPIINFSVLVWSMYIIKNGFMQKKKEFYERLKTIIGEISECTVSDKYDNIKGKLSELDKEIESLSQILYQIKDKQENEIRR